MTSDTQPAMQEGLPHGTPLVTRLLTAHQLRRRVWARAPALLGLGLGLRLVLAIGLMISLPVFADRERVVRRYPLSVDASPCLSYGEWSMSKHGIRTKFMSLDCLMKRPGSLSLRRRKAVHKSR